MKVASQALIQFHLLTRDPEFITHKAYLDHKFMILFSWNKFHGHNSAEIGFMTNSKIPISSPVSPGFQLKFKMHMLLFEGKNDLSLLPEVRFVVYILHICVA